MQKHREKPRTAVMFGQTVVDVYPLFDVTPDDITEHSVHLRDNGRRMDIEVDGRLAPGAKCFARKNFSLNGFAVQEGFGGGVFGSHREYRRLQDVYAQSSEYHPSRVFYVDLSAPGKAGGSMIIPVLEEYGTESLFGNQREMPHSHVLMKRNDKRIVKNRVWDRRFVQDELDHHVVDRAKEAVRSSDTVFVNSGRTQSFMTEFMSEVVDGKKDFYAVLTHSMPWEFAKEMVAPYGTLISNYDELGTLMGDARELDENARVEYAFEWAKRLRNDGVNNRFSIHVTAGRNGMVVADNERAYHISLVPEISERIQERLRTSPEIYGTTGAGDTYAGAVFFYESELGNHDVQAVAKLAAMSAIRHIGYRGPLSQDDFIVKSTMPLHRCTVGTGAGLGV